MPSSFNFVLETISDHLGKSEFGAFSTRAFDSPLTIVLFQAHFAAQAPPMVDFSRDSEPDSFFQAQLAQEAQQIPIDALCLLLDDVVWMNDKTHQAVFL